jgi:molybdopterin synthase catalytic subunit
MIQASITRSPIDPAGVLSQVGGLEDGAAILFLGTVRNHAEGRAVEGLAYESYEPMARDVLDRVAHEAAERWAVQRVAVVHRVGELEVGEASVAIAVSSPHRAEAFAAARYVIEEIKVRVPIWKKEHFVDGTEAWVEGSVPPVDATAERDS